MKRRELLKLGAVAGGMFAFGAPERAAGRAAAKVTAVPAVDRLIVTNVVDNIYDVFAKEGKLDAIAVQRTSLGAGGVPLLAEHGLAYHLASERGSERREILLDFSLTDTALFVNYRALRVDPTHADAFILSHGHQDHYGGLPALALAWQGKFKPGVMVYAGGEDSFCQRVVVTPTGATLDQGQLDQARLEALGLKTTIVKQPAVVADHAFTSGQIPRLTAFERPPAAARLVAGPVDSACAASLHFPIGTLKVAAPPGALVSDTFQGEHATAYHVRDRGLVVITSCGHAGVINSVRQCQKVSGIDKVHAIVGGFHLAPAPDEIVAKTVEAFKQIDPDYIIPAHCTGLNTIMAVHRELPKKLVMPSTGTRVIFGA
jgi:7,8-dihydropterin-6-yl-methyl-4-(beta-D-ribofuranosyl)aminobenzene 5'-phosphate synthase